jgi:hypothetical protein
MTLRNWSRWAANPPTGTQESIEAKVASFEFRMKTITEARKAAVWAGFSASC